MTLTARKTKTLTGKSKKPKREKNPIAIAIGKRMRKARQEAHLTINDINEQRPDWSASRLRNYEQGFSLAGPEEVNYIANITRHSCCWIMFGKGPISAQTRTVQAIRHQNMVYLVNLARADNRFTFRNFLHQIQLTEQQITNHIEDPARNIGKRLGRRLENYFTKPKLWLDEQHIESDGLSTSYPPDLQALMAIHSELSPPERLLLLDMAKALQQYSSQ
ncbi:MAG: hypothetical protein V3W04_14635 [Gammaproteobacteria bacterium]